MRISGFTVAAGAAVLALIAAQPAFATQMQAEITGTATIVDTTGFFGTPNTNFTSPFDVTFFVNDAGVTLQNSSPGFTNIAGFVSTGTQQAVQGDIEFGNLGGFSFGYDFGPPDGDTFGEVASGLIDPAQGFGAGAGAIEYDGSTTLSDSALNLIFEVDFILVSPTNFGRGSVFDYNHPFSYTFTPDDQVLQANGRYSIDAFTPQALPALMTFELSPETLTVTSNEVLGGVPEPGAWALMILGFGGVGAALRRRPPQARRVLLQTT
jgi:hypothetical protein